MWNVPEKDKFLRLPPEDRRPIMASLEAYVAWVSVATTILFMGVQVGTYLAATGRTAGLPHIEVFLFGYVGVILVGVLRLNRRLKRRILEATHDA
jgi:hypothetical protein